MDALEALISSGSLRIVAGRLTSIEAGEDGLAVRWQPRNGSGTESIRVAAVVNCTGPETDVRRLKDALIADLLRQRIATCDAAGLGLRVDDDYRLLTADGKSSGRVSLTGPLLRGEYWEATAVPELRVHAARLAERLVAESDAGVAVQR